MIRLTLIFFALLATISLSYAQQSVDARQIIDRINQQQPVRYENVVIKGTLDLTDLNNREVAEESGGWFGNKNYTYESTVEVPLVFVNCTFQDDVLAYYHNDDEDDTYTAQFAEDVQFQGCTFQEASEFKYSEFAGAADFRGTIFREEANYKYAEFAQAPNFSQVVFGEAANFKYAEFPRNTLFTATVFEQEANFKYADFPAGASFEGVVFNDLANFKYTKFSEPLNLKNVSFNGSEDFKYTEVNGEDFSTYLLKHQ